MTKVEYQEFRQVCWKRMTETSKRKNHDYTGSGDDPFKNFRCIGMYDQGWIMIGFITRMQDKMSRFASFIQRGILLVKDESLEDSILDLAEYCILVAGYIKSLKGKK